eukprot:TRINITY_DN12992_c0_g1_i26.p5 TRINITY_DN12992_c0_g1~~TRINITY_DN12992_c0_g1_i26.p5  ORF type:complete len:143 (-),score=28.84 TRINITY_DN12992_c0_g1_i26:763-1128(-)
MITVVLGEAKGEQPQRKLVARDDERMASEKLYGKQESVQVMRMAVLEAASGEGQMVTIVLKEAKGEMEEKKTLRATRMGVLEAASGQGQLVTIVSGEAKGEKPQRELVAGEDEMTTKGRTD